MSAVTEEMVVLALISYDGGEIAGAMERALAAVVPIIEAREREACAVAAEMASLAPVWDDAAGAWGTQPDAVARRCAAAIRARTGETT